MLRVVVGLWSICALAAAAPPVNGADPTGHAAAVVTGTVSYRERIALPPTASLRVQLLDVSRADAPAVVLGERRIAAGGRQVPFRFAIPYDPARIDPRMTYAVQARIENAGRLLFVNDRHYGVLTRGGAAHVEMVLKAVRGR